jgi:hypothetical protein
LVPFFHAVSRRFEALCSDRIAIRNIDEDVMRGRAARIQAALGRASPDRPNAVNGGLQDLHQSVTGLGEGVVCTNLRATLVRAIRRTAKETLRPLEQQIGQRQQARHSGQVFQNAAVRDCKRDLAWTQW